MEARRTDARVAAMVAAHGEALRRVARRYSASAEDAEDAVQRGLEIYVRRLARVDPATELAWLKVVVRHEALAVGRARGEAVGGEIDLDAQPAPDQRPLDELVAGRERAGRVAEALRRLKPDEARALLLKADGLSYSEIGERMSWSYTKVNRALTEGRKRFFEVYREIEAGEACEQAAPALAALARGRADARTIVELRPHLRHCSACRATVRRMHARRRVRAAALAPVPWLQGLAQRLGGAEVLAGAQYAAAAGGGRAAALGAVAALCAAGCAPVGTEAGAAPAARAASSARPAPAGSGAGIAAASPAASTAVPVAVTARRADRAPAAGPEFTFEPTAESGREESGAVRAGTFERGGAARSATGAGFERRGTPSDTFERPATASSGGSVERDEPRTARGGFERDVATPTWAHEQSARREPHSAAARRRSSAVTTTAASTAFERTEPHPPAAGADPAAPVARAAFERSEPHPTETRRTDPAAPVARAAFERSAP